MDAARLVAKRGYTNIMVFRDGIPGWIDAGYTVKKSAPKDNYKVQWIDPAGLNAALDQYLVVDIRPASAYKKGYLPGSRAMPMAYLSMLSAELSKERRIVLIDNGGHQLIKAAQWMTDNGFEDITILKGGMTAYIKAGFELKK